MNEFLLNVIGNVESLPIQKQVKTLDKLNRTQGRALRHWCTLPTEYGPFRMYDTGEENVRLITMGDIATLTEEPYLRVHSSCLASEVFGARDCDCADQLDQSMRLIATEGTGVIIHLHQEGRGHGLSKKLEQSERWKSLG